MEDLELSDARWVRSSFSGAPDKTCVEVAQTDGVVGVRNSNDPSEIVIFTTAEWDKFLMGVREGEFDLSV